MKQKYYSLLLLSASIALGGCAENSQPPYAEKTIVLTSNGAPEKSVGDEFDIFIDSTNMDVYCKEKGNWFPGETRANNVLIGKKENDDWAKELSAIAKSFYLSNVNVDFEFEGNGLFTHEIAQFKNGVLFNEVYTSKDAYVEKDKTGGYYQHQRFYYENNEHYVEAQGGEKQEIDSTSRLYGMASTSFDKFIGGVLGGSSFAASLMDVATGKNTSVTFKNNETVMEFTNFDFTYSNDNKYLTDLTFENTSYGISYNVVFSNFESN